MCVRGDPTNEYPGQRENTRLLEERGSKAVEAALPRDRDRVSYRGSARSDISEYVGRTEAVS